MSPPTLTEIQRLEQVLSLEPIRNVSNIGFLRNNPITDCWVVGDAVLFCGISDHEWVYVSATSEAQLTALLSHRSPAARYFAAIEAWMEPIILGDRPAKWRLLTRRFVLPTSVPATPVHPDASPLRPDDAVRVHRRSEYRDLAPASYIRDRIERGPSVGIRRGGELVAWGLTHDDGALGMIHVLPDARRQGLGAAILASLAHLALAAGSIPFSHIEETNPASIGMHRRVGFVADRQISWVERGDKGVRR